MVEVTYQMVLSTLQTAGILVGIIYYLTIMRNAQRNQEHQLETRQAQLFYGIYNRMSQADFVDAMNAFVTWEYTTTEEVREIRADKLNSRYIGILSNHFEGLGMLVRLGLMPIRYVAHIHPRVTQMYWEKHGPIVLQARKRFNDPRRHTEAEYLYNELMKYLEEHPEIPT